MFSVIVPVYNKADTITASVDSVLAQTVSDFEIIIVDDGSTDNLTEALASYGDRLRVIHQKNGGVSVARNTGIQAATGEYICFLDADDLWLPDHLQTVSDLIETYPSCSVFVTSHVVQMPDGTIRNSGDLLTAYGDSFETADFIGVLNRTSYGVVNTNSVCAAKAVFDKDNIAFEPGVKIGEDTDVWYRLTLKNRVAVSAKNTTVYRREYSTATKNTSHTHEWIFCRRESAIMADAAVSDDVKRSVRELLDRYRLTSSREYMMNQNRTAAKSVLALIYNTKGKRYWLTKLFTWLPYGVCRVVYKRVMKIE